MGQHSELIWHYTGPEALYPILSPDGGLLATHQAFMNDISDCELVRRINRCMAEILDCSIIAPDSELPREYVEYKHGLRAGTHHSTFVSCFSVSFENPLLWRCYTPNGGFAIGISRKEFEQSIGIIDYSLPAIRFGNCSYTEWEEVNQLLETTESDLHSKAMRLADPMCSAEEKVTIYSEAIQLVLEFSRKFAFVKHPFFKDEQEYRFVLSFKDPVSIAHLIMLDGKPRVRIPLTVPFSSLVKYIYVSPLGNQEANLQSAKILASSIGLPLSNVECKDFPIR